LDESVEKGGRLKLKYNPIVGYCALDKDYHVIGPPGKKLDPAFETEERACQAAVRYGWKANKVKAGALYLGGILGVVFEDVGDIHLDDGSAQRLIDACAQNGFEVKDTEKAGIRPEEGEPIYSCRRLLGAGRSGRLGKHRHR
jgi:hypothetical protein